MKTVKFSKCDIIAPSRLRVDNYPSVKSNYFTYLHIVEVSLKQNNSYLSKKKR